MFCEALSGLSGLDQCLYISCCTWYFTGTIRHTSKCFFEGGKYSYIYCLLTDTARRRINLREKVPICHRLFVHFSCAPHDTQSFYDTILSKISEVELKVLLPFSIMYM